MPLPRAEPAPAERAHVPPHRRRRPRRRPPERAAAWLVTGPLGHLWGVGADVAGYALRHLAARARERLRRRARM